MESEADHLREIIAALTARADNAEADAQHAREESLSAFEAVAGAQTCERAARADATRLAEALQDARDALAQHKPCGHDGDEESGVHDEDCDLCFWEVACAAIDAALAAHDAGGKKGGG